MGNRAVVTTKSATGFCEESIGIYLHWNGGRDSVTGFLKYCELQGFRSPEIDSDSWLKFQQVILNCGLTADRDKCKNLDCDNGDNGVYLVENWQIVGRKFMEHAEQDVYPLKDMLLGIDEKQPVHMQIHDKIIMEFDTKKIVMDIGGDAESGYRVIQIRITENGRHYSTLYHDMDYDKVVDWMHAHAEKNGFTINAESGKLEKTA